MGLFKKKKEVKPEVNVKEGSLMFAMEEIPYEALNIIYGKKMGEYQTEIKNSVNNLYNGKAEALQKDLTIISHHLQKSSVSDETESIYNFFMDLGIPRSDLLDADLEYLKRMKKAHEELKKSFAELTKVDEPKDINLNIKIDIPDIKSDEPEAETKETHEEENKKNWQGFKKLIHTDKEEEEHVDSEIEKQAKQLQSMTKNKDIASVLVELEKEKQEFLESTKDTNDPNKTKTSFFKKKKLITEGGLPDKKLRKIDYLCLDCSHSMKDHLNGCGCGCMTSIDEIKDQHNIIKTNVKLEELEPDLPIDQSDGLHNKLTEQEELDIEKLMKQTKQTESMIKPIIPSPLTTPIQLPPIQLPPIQQINPKEKPISNPLQCTCDHYNSEHYEGKFCLLCNCSKFTSYPNEQKK